MKSARIVMLAVVLVAAIAALANFQSDGSSASSRVVVAKRDPSDAAPDTRPAKNSTKNPVADLLTSRYSTPLTPIPSEFQPVLERSLFSAQRQSRRGGGDPELASATIAAPPAPEASLVLCGVSQQGDMFTALVEDMNGRRVTRLSPGDSIGRGRLVRVDLDGIEYEVAGESRRVRVGDDLTGATPAFALDDSPATQPAKIAKRNKPKPTDPPPLQPNDTPRASKDNRPDRDDYGSKKKDKGMVQMPVELFDPARANKDDWPKKPKDKQAQETKIKGGGAAWPGRVD